MAPLYQFLMNPAAVVILTASSKHLPGDVLDDRHDWCSMSSHRSGDYDRVDCDAAFEAEPRWSTDHHLSFRVLREMPDSWYLEDYAFNGNLHLLPNRLLSEEVVLNAKVHFSLKEIPPDLRTEKVCQLAVLWNGIDSQRQYLPEDVVVPEMFWGGARELQNIPPEYQFPAMIDIAIHNSFMYKRGLLRYVRADLIEMKHCLVALSVYHDEVVYVPGPLLTPENIKQMIAVNPEVLFLMSAAIQKEIVDASDRVWISSFDRTHMLFPSVITLPMWRELIDTGQFKHVPPDLLTEKVCILAVSKKPLLYLQLPTALRTTAVQVAAFQKMSRDDRRAHLPELFELLK